MFSFGWGTAGGGHHLRPSQTIARYIFYPSSYTVRRRYSNDPFIIGGRIPDGIVTLRALSLGPAALLRSPTCRQAVASSSHHDQAAIVNAFDGPFQRRSVVFAKIPDSH